MTPLARRRCRSSAFFSAQGSPCVDNWPLPLALSPATESPGSADLGDDLNGLVRFRNTSHCLDVVQNDSDGTALSQAFAAEHSERTCNHFPNRTYGRRYFLVARRGDNASVCTILDGDIEQEPGDAR